MAKQKTKGNNVVGRVSKEKAIPVANDSLQTRAPGAGPGNLQSGNRGQSLGFGGSWQGERGGPGTQQASWSSRQQAQRMRARAEEERLGAARQSGYGGSQQSQAAGSEESAHGPIGARQGGGGRESSKGTK
ncbi:hypothetical protein [Pseudoduganella sp. GCM10020061]|uniref:hypothetical protein n=1 Tax=Pseudoduganella sp. GCM10020061 TaxID=3317345 RepID=UPI003630EC7C